MNLLIFSRPGVRIYQELRKSETAWHALRFYSPLEIPVGIVIPLSSLSAALTLASDLKYFIRKYSVDHLFELPHQICCTAAVAKSRYLTRDDIPEPWPWKLWYFLPGDGSISRHEKPPVSCVSEENRSLGGYVFEVWCSEEEYSVYRYVNKSE